MGFPATTPTPTPPGPPGPAFFSKPLPQCPNTSTTPLFFPIPPQLSFCSSAKPQPHVHPFFPLPPHSCSLLPPGNPKPRPHFISLPVPEPWPLSPQTPLLPIAFPPSPSPVPPPPSFLEPRTRAQTTPPPPSRLHPPLLSSRSCTAQTPTLELVYCQTWSLGPGRDRR